MKNCKSIENKLTAYIHGELKAGDVQTVKEHLASCEACRSEVELLRGTLDLLGQALENAHAPSELKPWWHLSARIRAPRKTFADFWYGPRCKAILASTAVFVVLFLVSVNLVVFQVFMKDDASFEEVEVSFNGGSEMAARPKMELKKPKTGADPEPATTQQIVSKVKRAKMPEIQLAEMDSFHGSYAVGGEVSLFGAAMPSEQYYSSEAYDLIVENSFKAALDNPLSTFSIDVDTAAYANVRRFLNDNSLPPVDAVRIEEMVNYFDYDYPEPVGEDPFVVSMEVDDCPWNAAHQLALIGLQGVELETADLPPNNLVFLLDVSGSMESADKLPLLKSAIRLLVDQLRPEDRVSIVVYAGAAGVVLEPTNNKAEILSAIDRLSAGGSTAGGAGLELAYRTAKLSFDRKGNNRVILATDGDFNVGPKSDSALVRMIEKKRDSGIYLTVLGFGTGNLKDSKMEKLADKGNGNYAYIDDILEAKKVLVNEMGGTLMTIAKDVKVQVEFNPSQIKGYRLIGYENRVMAHEDFADDKKDAGELGAGHTVTALYELIPTGVNEPIPGTGALKYQRTSVVDSDELMTVKLRYKKPDGDVSKLITKTVAASDLKRADAAANIGFAGAVAEFGMLLRDSEFKANASYENVLDRAKTWKGSDPEGYRSEFIRMVEKARLLDRVE